MAGQGAAPQLLRTRASRCPACAPPLVQAKSLPPIYRGKWASAPKEEVDEMLAKGVPHCYRFRVPSNQVVKIQVRLAGWVGGLVPRGGCVWGCGSSA